MFVSLFCLVIGLLYSVSLFFILSSCSLKPRLANEIFLCFSYDTKVKDLNRATKNKLRHLLHEKFFKISFYLCKKLKINDLIYYFYRFCENKFIFYFLFLLKIILETLKYFKKSLKTIIIVLNLNFQVNFL